MRQSIRISVAALAAATMLAVQVGPAAAFTTDEQKCRSTVAKNGGKLTKAILKALTACHKARAKDNTLSGTDCNSIDQADAAKMKVAKTEDKLIDQLSGAKSKCNGIDPADVLFYECPAPCAGAIADFADVADCLVCLTRAHVEDFSDATNGMPVSPLDATDSKCQGAIGSQGAKVFNSAIKETTKCQAAVEKGGGESVTVCTDTGYPSAKLDATAQKALASISTGCAAPNFGNLDSCGASQFMVSACVPLEAQNTGQIVATAYLQLGDAPPPTTLPPATSTTMPASDPACPDLGELTLFSRDTNTSCATNDDCTAPRTCNTTFGICQAAVRLDSGWTGVSHGADINDGVRVRANLHCPGGPGAPCGECDVLGIDPEPGNCRCSNDIRQICDRPFQPDNDDCGGAVCDCYFGAPFPLSSGNAPVCVVNRFAEDISGTADVDLGAGEISANLRTGVFLGPLTYNPCPVCGGKCLPGEPTVSCVDDGDCGMGNTCTYDATPGDGTRDGLCFTADRAGEVEGDTCDPIASNATFPAQIGADGGAQYSLDCMPDAGLNISSSGLIIQLDQTTGTASLPAALDCDGAGAGTDLCPCKVCSANEEVPCRSDGECAFLGGACTVAPLVSCTENANCASANIGPCAGTMTRRCVKKNTVSCVTNDDCLGYNAGDCDLATCDNVGIYGVATEPNDCNGGTCNDIGGGNGECAAGPTLKFCDAYVRATGEGFLSCSSDVDCTLGGTCSLTSQRPCYLDPIQATGQPDPDFPIAVATFCIPPTSNPGINGVAGLPGPGRVQNQGAALTFCSSDHGTTYEPGVGGCP